MLKSNKASRRLLNAFGFALVVPVVVTCGGRGIMEFEHDAGGTEASSQVSNTGQAAGFGGAASNNETQIGPSGGATTIEASGTQAFAGGSPQTGTSGQVGYGGSSFAATGGATATGPWEAKVFLGAYLEPVTDSNYRVPAPPATAWVTRPCDEHKDVCAGSRTRDDWAKNVVTRCMAETSSGGCIDFIFEDGDTCSQYVVVWKEATLDLGRCVSTVAYYEGCSTPSSGSSMGVHRYGTDCPP